VYARPRYRLSGRRSGRGFPGVPRSFDQSGRTLAPIRDNTNKIGFVLTYAATAAGMLGVMSYLLTGKQPEGGDWVFPRVGGENPDGSPRRITSMTYLREIPMVMKHIQEQASVPAGVLETIYNKMMLEPIREILNNRDYFGTNIYDENAPWYKQVWQTLRHIAGDSTPMSFSSAERARDTGGTWVDEALAYAGFGPAPSYVEKSAIQNRIAHLYDEHVAPKSRPYEDEAVTHEKLRARTRLLRAKHSGDSAQIAEATQNARKAGLSNEAIERIGRTPSDVYLFSRLPQADQEAILRQANDQEFARYVTHAQMKLRAPMRQERAGHKTETPTAPPPSRPAPAPAPPPSRPAPMPPPTLSPVTPPPPRGRSRADDLLRQSPRMGGDPPRRHP
jgi:hypothetical protein